jgi:hypothetical protein
MIQSHMSQAVAVTMALLLAAVPASAETYRDPANHFEFEVPGGWFTWSRESLANANRFARGVANDSNLGYSAGFQPRGRPIGTYPHLLVQVVEQSSKDVSYEDIESIISRQTWSTVRQVKGSLPDILKNVSVGSVALDREHNRVVMRMQLSNASLGTIDGLTLSMIGRDAIVSLHYYDHAKSFDQSVNNFFTYANTFEFDKGYRYKPRPSSTLSGAQQGALVGGITGACLAAAAAIVLRGTRGSKRRHNPA